MPGVTFSKLPYAFPHSNIQTWKTIQSRTTFLSGFEPSEYDCCINSCCCFVGPYAEHTQCVHCNEPRFDSIGKSRQVFVYLPVIPRLKAFLSNQEMAAKMQYRSQHQHNPGITKDVFDSTHYRSLLAQKVSINNRFLNHTFFSDFRDIALGLTTDGFAPFRRRKKTAWPMILINYNLPPEVRFHADNILSLGVIPGPKKPHDWDSFAWPLIQELLELQVGIHTYDKLADEFFALHAYLILVFGDIPAVSMLMRMKGHNGLSPCRMCSIHGVRIPNSRTPVHYVPLDRSRHPNAISSSIAPHYDPRSLPLRTQTQFMQQAQEVQSAEGESDYDNLAKVYGIKGIPALSVLSSLSFPLSFPYDFMHLVWENVIKNLIGLWTGEYKALDEGSESYQIQQTVWEAIGAASLASGSLIPTAFGPRPPNIASDKTSWTADTRSFWTLFLGPVLLRGRFLNEKYYRHFTDLVRLLNLCLQFEISRVEIESLRGGFIKWVEDYEK